MVTWLSHVLRAWRWWLSLRICQTVTGTGYDCVVARLLVAGDSLILRCVAIVIKSFDLHACSQTKNRKVLNWYAFPKPNR